MKKIYIFTFAILLGSLSLSAQEKLADNIGLGIGLPFTDLQGVDYQGYTPNLSINAGIVYKMTPALKLRGDATAVKLNGNNNQRYFQAQIYEPSAALELNLIQLIDPSADLKLNVLGGLGMGFLKSNVYDITTRQRLAEVPANRDNTFSLTSFALLGGNVGIPMSENMDLNLGYGHRFAFGQPWIDGTDPESSDSYGIIQAGFTYHLSKPKDPNKMEVEKSKYDNLNYQVDSLSQAIDRMETDQEQLARLEMSNQEKEMQLEMLRSEMDSLQMEKEKLQQQRSQDGSRGDRGSGQERSTRDMAGDPSTEGSRQTSRSGTRSQGEATSDEDVATLDNVMYRVIIGSLKTKRQAQRFKDQSSLDKSQMMVVYASAVDSYRIVYKSAGTMTEARKYLDEAKRAHADAWIIRF